MRALIVCLVLCVVLAMPSTAGSEPPPGAHSSAYISIAYGKRVLRGYINDKYAVVRGPTFFNCSKPNPSKVQCDIDFRAGLYARCARGSVRNSGGYDYIRLLAPIC